MTVFEMIEAQQKGKEDTSPWMAGEQLKDICRQDPHCAEIVAQDLENPSMSIVECEKKIKAKADEIQKKSKQKCVCITPNTAERIIREFYGLPDAKTTALAPASTPEPEPEEFGILNLSDLLG